MGFPRQEYWGELPSPSPKDHLNPGNDPASPVLAGGFFTTEPRGMLSQVQYTLLITLSVYARCYPISFMMILKKELTLHLICLSYPTPHIFHRYLI